jgi:hypothetical protein
MLVPLIVTSFRESGNPARSGDLDPRLRGGDESLTLISMGGPQAMTTQG